MRPTPQRRVDIRDTPGRWRTPINILLAEDEAVIALSLSSFLESHGYDVLVARDGAEALAFYREQRPAALLTDIRMPNLSGIELVRTIRATDSFLPIVVLTASRDRVDMDFLMLVGAFVLHKPVDMRHLRTALRRLWVQPNQRH